MVFADSIPKESIYRRMSLTIAETIIPNPKNPNNIATRKASKAIGTITMTKIIAANNSGSSEKSNFFNFV